MPDEPQTTQATETQAQEAEPAASTSQPSPAMTMADFEKFRNSMFADMRKMVESVAKPKTNGKASEPHHETKAAPPAQDVEAILARRAEIDEAMDEHSLTKEQKKTLRQLVGIDKPDDVTAYIASKAKIFGRPSSSEAAQPQSRNTTGRPPVSDAGSPAAPPTFTDDTPLVSMKPEDRAEIIRRKGGEWYRNTLRQQMRGVRVRIR